MKCGRSTLFLVRYDIGSNYLRDLSPEEQPGFIDHTKYMDLHHAAGNLLFGGLLLNHVEACSVTGGVLIFRAYSEKEVHDLALRDPAVKNGMFEIKDIKHWVPMIGHIGETNETNALWSTEQEAASP